MNMDDLFSDAVRQLLEDHCTPAQVRAIEAGGSPAALWQAIEDTGFADALVKILEEARTEPELVKGAPHTMPVRRLDDVRAARELDLVWRPAAE